MSRLSFPISLSPSLRCLSGWVLHLLGVGLIARLTHQPLWLAVLAVLLFRPLYVTYRHKESFCAWLSTLSPLLIVYAAALLRILIAFLVRLTDPVALESIPSPWGTLLDLNRLMLFCGLGVLFLQTRPRWRGHFVLLISLLWAGLTYFSLATHGVSAIDPYGYVQMAVDLAEEGTALHTFALAPQAAALNLPLYPTVPLGFTFPDPLTGKAGTAWPPGHSVFLALGYRLAGEAGLYQTAPLLGLITLGVMWLLSLVLFPQDSGFTSTEDQARLPAAAYWTAGLTVFLLATSRQQIEWLTVAMSDVSAMLWELLLLLFVTVSQRRQSVPAAFLAGACLGLAFDMRYTQVLLVIPTLFLLLIPWQRSTITLKRVIAFGLGAFLLALPMLAYYTVAFGSPFSTGSRELGHFALANIGPNLLTIARGLLAGAEFLWLLPFVIGGMIVQSRTDRLKLVGLGLVVGVLIVFHLPYKLLSIRHLLPIFPIIAFWAALGFVALLHTLKQKSTVRYLPGLAVTLLLLLLLLRGQSTLFLMTNPYFATYGYVTPEQRVTLDTFAELTPPTAVIATSLTGGAITLYADRTIVRPSDWSPEEWLIFVDYLKQSGRPLYVLVDGETMEGPFTTIQAHYALTEIDSLPLTYFFADGRGVSQNIPLYQVEF